MLLQITETELLNYRRRFKGAGFSYHDAAGFHLLHVRRGAMIDCTGRKTSQHYKGLLGEAPALRRVSPPIAHEASDTRPQRRPFSFSNYNLLCWKPDVTPDAYSCKTRNYDLPNKQHKLNGTGVVVDQELRSQRLTKRFGYALRGSGLQTCERIIPRDECNSEKIKFVKRVQIERPPSHPEVINYRFSGGICPPYKASLNPNLTQKKRSLVY